MLIIAARYALRVQSRFSSLLKRKNIVRSLSLEREDDIFSPDFYPLLESESSSSTSLAQQLHSLGYTADSSIPLLSSKTCQTLKETTIPNLFRGNFDTGVYPDEWHWREGISRSEAAREMCNSWKSSTTIASIVLNESLGKFVSQVMGWESVRIAQDDIVWKPPQTRQPCRRRIDTVGFHQDSAYISTQFQPYENNSVTLWMALDDTDEENGCLEYATGSHKWHPHHQSINDDSDISSFHNSDEESYRSGALNEAHLAYLNTKTGGSDDHSLLRDIRKAPVKAGQAILHHQDVWHGSGPNTSSTRHRRALVAHYLRGDVQFVEDDDENKNDPPFLKTSYIYGRYKKYQSIEVDESFFPIIYSSNEGQLRRTEWIDNFNVKTAPAR